MCSAQNFHLFTRSGQYFMDVQPNDSSLSSSTTVSKYLEMEAAKDVDGILAFVDARFSERYIDPFAKNQNKHGFIMMASACLMIETLESFWQGWPKSPSSPLAFCQFFDRSLRFTALRGFSREFYIHVRCGILHQGETTGGWHINRKKLNQLFDASTRTLNATVFLREMKGSLSDYRSSLKAVSWDSEIWENFRKKMKNICVNTEVRN